MDLVVNQVLASDPLLLLYTLQQGPPTPLTSWEGGGRVYICIVNYRSVYFSQIIAHDFFKTNNFNIQRFI